MKLFGRAKKPDVFLMMASLSSTLRHLLCAWEVEQSRKAVSRRAFMRKTSNSFLEEEPWAEKCRFCGEYFADWERNKHEGETPKCTPLSEVIQIRNGTLE